MLDAFQRQRRGGTGKTFDWDVARRARSYGRIFLAGGLTPENVAEAIHIGKPYAVDVCSGVEAKPGKKDPARMKALLPAAGATAKKTPCGASRVKAKTKRNTMSYTAHVVKERGRYGPYGGRYVPETLMAPLEELELAYSTAGARRPQLSRRSSTDLLRNFAGRPTPLQLASRLTEHLGSARIYIKREDLLHTGAHKINNCIGQVLLAMRMGKKRIIAETGAGQHGVATATVAAQLGLTCTVYMGTEDMERQRLNVLRMRLLGAEVIGVDAGSRTLKDAINEAMRDWVTNVRTTYYLLGSVLGAHPYPMMVRDFQKIIGEEARTQILEAERRLPDYLIACVGGGSNAMGLFHAFLGDAPVKMVGVEAGGRGNVLGEHAARLASSGGFTGAHPGVLQGTYTYVLQTADGQIATTHSISAGLDYPGVGPEHAWLADLGRAEYTAVSDDLAIDAARTLARVEGIIPALESAHAVAELIRRAPKLKKERNRDPQPVRTRRQRYGNPLPLCLKPPCPTHRPLRKSPPGALPQRAGSRITQRFRKLAESGELGLVAYITAGDPSLDATLKIVLAAAEAGADVIELGVPFSDPVADGPTIQRASERALAAGATLAGVIDLVARIRLQSDVPRVLFSYYNPMLQMGLDKFAAAAAAAGADGVLATDLTPEEADDYRAAMLANNLDTIFLVAPTSTDGRIAQIAECSSGFLYLISRMGVTGTREALPEDLPALARRVRQFTKLPLAVGFGISSPAHVSVLGGHCRCGGSRVGDRI